MEAAWAQGLVVVVAAGNSDAGAESILAPGNDPYVITVGAVNAKRTPGYWADDELPAWSACGPTKDGFIKPDLLAPGANIVSFMYNDPADPANAARLALSHPDYSSAASLFRMSGTSMSAAVTSGVVALLLQYRPGLTPDQVKFRLMASARQAVLENGAPLYNLFQQGQGRLWAPDAVLQELPDGDNAGRPPAGMDIQSDLQHAGGWVDANQDGLVQPEELDPAEMAFHYVGPVGRLVSDDGGVWLYYLADGDQHLALGAAQAADGRWLDRSALDGLPGLAWSGGALGWPGTSLNPDGTWTWGSGYWSWGGGYWSWGGGYWSWGGGYWSWGGGYRLCE